jgi:hypothetical protein
MHHVKILTQSFIYVFYGVALKGSQLYTPHSESHTTIMYSVILERIILESSIIYEQIHLL